mmetsp:Transcript_20179/g.50213  ORF Transcript_20179/g.50213 Transcript_20179/m.50213 type:complete len:402 (-) Transcript_20179:143-1348(-)
MQQMAKVVNPFQSKGRWRGPSFPVLIAGGFLFIMITSVARVHRFLLGSTGDIASNLLKEEVSFLAAGIRVHRETIDGRDVLWASPRDNDRGNIKGLLFLAHGCGHSNRDWFSKGTECEDCVGLPEEKAIVETALDLGLVAIATSSSNWNTKCWSGFDVTPVALVLNELWHRFSQEEGIPTNLIRRSLRDLSQQQERLPLYAFGASSGGAFVSSLASPLRSRFGIKLDGFVSQIAAHLPTFEEEEKDPHNLCKVYVTMNKDTKTDHAAVARVEKCLKEFGNGDRCKHIRLAHLEIKPSYFADRIQDVSLTESYEITKVLTQGGFLKPEDRELLEDPRTTHERWSNALRKASSKSTSALDFTKNDALVADKSPIFEELNVAWGYHEMAREGVKDALEFCMRPS